MPTPHSNGGDADVPENAIFVAFRVSDVPDPDIPCQRRSCTNCGEPIWVADDGLPVADRRRILCVQCVTGDHSD
jgi:hypothetical protein